MTGSWYYHINIIVVVVGTCHYHEGFIPLLVILLLPLIDVVVILGCVMVGGMITAAAL
jgi:hypothetical protein